MKFTNWEYYGSAEILSADELADKIEQENEEDWYDPSPYKPLVLTSGGYDPIHPGHISCIAESARYGDLVVVVNGDAFLTKKKGKPFMDLKTRCQIVAGIRNVRWVVPFEIENDQTVIEAIKIIKPTIFTKGGDRVDEKTIPEWDICNYLGVKIITGVGLAKQWSSSDIVKQAN